MRTLFLLFVLSLALYGETLAPASPCVTDLLSNYVALPSNGCNMVGSLNVTSFNFSVITSTIAIAASDITVTPFANLHGLTFSSPKFNISEGNKVIIEIDYTWDPGDIRSMEDILNANTPVSPGFVTITTKACEGFPFVAGLCNGGAGTVATVTVSHHGMSGPPPVLLDVASWSPVANLGIINTVDYEAIGAGASSEFSSFGNIVTPEPSTVMGGVVVLAMILRRYRLGNC